MSSYCTNVLLGTIAVVLCAPLPQTLATAVELELVNGDSSPIECDACKVVAAEIWKAGENLSNETRMHDVIKVLEQECATKFNTSSVDRDICDLLVDGLVQLLPFAYKQFNVIAWDSANLCAVANLCTVNCCNGPTPTTPEQVHLSLTRDPSEMAVMWTTLNTTATHSVKYGLSAADLNESNTDGTTSTYTHFSWVGHFHTAKMTGLQPGTQYFYSVGDADGGWSQVFSFRTLFSDAGSDTHPLRVASIGDMGYAGNSDATVQRLTALVDAGAIDVVLHNGDISYADGEYSHWDIFMRKVEPIAARVPYQVTPGNHELWFNFSAYKHRFYMSDEGEHDNYFYGVFIGEVGTGVHFVGMSTESWWDLAHMDKRQVAWIDNELATVSKAKTPRWRIAYGHRPLYCSTHGGNDIPGGNAVLKKAVEDVLMNNHVDVVVQAHVHDYERTFPVYQDVAERTNYSDPRAPVYIVNGAAGNRESNGFPPGGNESYWPAAFNRTSLVSYGVFVITPQSVAWTQFVSSDNSVQDTFTITKTV